MGNRITKKILLINLNTPKNGNKGQMYLLTLKALRATQRTLEGIIFGIKPGAKKQECMDLAGIKTVNY